MTHTHTHREDCDDEIVFVDPCDHSEERQTSQHLCLPNYKEWFDNLARKKDLCRDPREMLLFAVIPFSLLVATLMTIFPGPGPTSPQDVVNLTPNSPWPHDS